MIINYTDLGLALDIIGALFLFLFGLPPQLSREGTITLSVGTSISEKNKAKRYDRLGKAGIGLIFFGFALQWLGNQDSSGGISVWALATIVICVLVATGLVVLSRKITKSKVGFMGQYLPQFNPESVGFNREHLWQFDITNTSGKHLAGIKLCLPMQVAKVDVLCPGSEAQGHSNVRELVLDDIGLERKITIRVWNMGSGAGTGEDVYLVLGKKNIKPKLLPSLDF